MPPPASRGLVRLTAVGAAEGLAYGVVRVLGVGGYRSGAALAVAAIVAVGGGLAFLATRDIDDSADRAIWVTAAALLAITFGLQAASVAPYSKGRLAEELHGLRLPFFERRTERETGHSWCSPRCPAVVATFSAPPTSVGSALDTVLAAMKRDNLVARSFRVPLSTEQTAPTHIATAAQIIDIRVTRRPAPAEGPLPRLVVEIKLAARRR